MLAVLGCETDSREISFDFIHSGCSVATKAGDETSRLTLKYTEHGLWVIRTNATLNCIIKTDPDCVKCKVSVDGNVIDYSVFVDSDMSANCICPVEEMSSVVAGLEEGVEYTFNYHFDGRSFAPISFTFMKSLNLVIDPDLYQVYP